MEYDIHHGPITEVECDVLIVNIFENVKTPTGATGAVDKALDFIISNDIIERDNFKGRLGETYVIPTYGKIPATKVLLVGLGKAENFSLNKVRVISAKVIKKCHSFLKAKNICSILHGAGIGGLGAFDCAQMVAEGSGIGMYSFDKYKTKKDNEYQINSFKIAELADFKVEHIKEGLEKGKIIAEAVNMARDLVNEPGSEVTPLKLAEIAKSLDLKTKIMETKEIEKLGMGAYLAVARGSEHDPKLIHMTYKPSNPKKKIALIGKGITFDSGGLNLKAATSMRNMKDDMAGSAAVLSVMKALCELKPEIEVHAVIAACENMPDGTSYRPGDVLRAMNGKTIEVDNTDAEGRLTLGDALCYAEKIIEPDIMIDIATLTGACLVALGEVAAGIMGNNQDLIHDLIDCAEDGGERFWQLPMYKEYFEGLKSDIADFKNSGQRMGGASGAALFLNEFVNDTPWAHIDIAGPAYTSKSINEIEKGATGAGVRTLINFIISLDK